MSELDTWKKAKEFDEKFDGWKIHHKSVPCVKDEFVINEIKSFITQEVKNTWAKAHEQYKFDLMAQQERIKALEDENQHLKMNCDGMKDNMEWLDKKNKALEEEIEHIKDSRYEYKKAYQVASAGILDLKQKLIQAHNKNTELKGMIRY